MTQDEKRRDLDTATLLGRCAAAKCPICTKTEWTAGPLRILAHATIDYGVVGNLPQIQIRSSAASLGELVISIRCSCGYLMLFDAATAGVGPQRS